MADIASPQSSNAPYHYDIQGLNAGALRLELFDMGSAGALDYAEQIVAARPARPAPGPSRPVCGSWDTEARDSADRRYTYTGTEMMGGWWLGRGIEG